MTRIRRLLAPAAALCVLGTAGMMTAGALPAQAVTSGPYMAQGETPEQTPGGSTLGEWPIAKGTSVKMICWTEGPYKDGSAKWFDIQSNVYPFTAGYVPANSVASQSKVGLCH